MTLSAGYAKIVEWSQEDQCYVGSAPGLVYGGCHGADEHQVFDELCQIVDEAIALYEQDGKPAAGNVGTRPHQSHHEWNVTGRADAPCFDH